MPKGYLGESCAETARKAIGSGEAITFWELYGRAGSLVAGGAQQYCST